MMFILIESLHTPTKPNEHSKVHKILISSEYNFKEIYDQTGVSVFLNREHLNSIYTGTTYFGDHHQGFLGCLRDHLYFLNKKGYPQEIFEFHFMSIPREGDWEKMIDFMQVVIAHKIIEDYTSCIRILIEQDILTKLLVESDLSALEYPKVGSGDDDDWEVGETRTSRLLY